MSNDDPPRACLADFGFMMMVPGVLRNRALVPVTANGDA